ncbi:glycosyltransferase family 4 protein [Coprobacter tertius]|uniref:Glycosyltransferase family 4 protein n=1 Tax=Coprobacter tertius TaxID=2944915 RepID=A0ABT1MDA6_9BACT|nr:glycosyltransferase family 1 protein [Coprobacter tertius]MCP9610624.1 glycosyltransferase family 4 protein [Coprobacter tertius]
MIIGLDAKRAIANHTGLGNYSRFMVDIMATYQEGHRYRLFIPKKKNNSSYEKLLKHANVRSELPHSSTMKRFSSLWRSFFIKKDLLKQGVQLYHGLSNELPIGIHKTGIKSVVTIHDLIFLRYPEYYHSIDRKIYNFKFRYACQVANRIVAISECTKRDIMHFYNIPESKIDVVYQGCGAQYSVMVSDEVKKQVREKYALPDRFILNVGSIETRKNLMLALKALKNVPEEIHLVAVGRRTAYVDELLEYARLNNLENRFHLIHDLPHVDLPAVYQLAELFVYPSRFEGFGIPIIEAMHSQLPVIAATGSCLEEAGGEHSLYVNPDDVQGMSDAINRVISDEELREEMVSEGNIYLRRFNEDVLADQMNKVYSKCFLSEKSPSIVPEDIQTVPYTYGKLVADNR